jgi:hypothetical protein
VKKASEVFLFECDIVAVGRRRAVVASSRFGAT